MAVHISRKFVRVQKSKLNKTRDSITAVDFPEASQLVFERKKQDNFISKLVSEELARYLQVRLTYRMEAVGD